MSKELITWNKIYSTGIDEIDLQHKKLTEIINKLFNAFTDGKAESILPNIINELLQYTEYHFKTEEELFEKYGYSQKAEHIKKHNTFTEQIKEWKKKSDKNEKDFYYDLINYLKQWFVEHIMQDDKSYGEILRNKGIDI